MTILTNLIIDYQKTKNETILIEILCLLKDVIKEKVDFVYYQKWYPSNIFSKCKYCKKCEHCKELSDSLSELKRRELCADCLDCICEKGYFNLNQQNLCEYEDVEQELKLEILRLINNYDVKVGEFKQYLSSSLWDWTPNFITVDFVQSITCQKMYKETEEEEEVIINIEDKTVINQISNLKIEDILAKCKTEKERLIVNFLIQNPELNQTELAEKLKMTKQNISLIINRLRKRLLKMKKYYLSK